MSPTDSGADLMSRAFVEGQNIVRHPLGIVRRWGKIGLVLAGQSPVPGYVSTPEGLMTFSAGDYLVTDDPPTHCWPVKKEIFERTYAEVVG